MHDAGRDEENYLLAGIVLNERVVCLGVNDATECLQLVDALYQLYGVEKVDASH